MYPYELYEYVRSTLPHLHMLLNETTSMNEVRKVLNRLTGLNVGPCEEMSGSEWKFIDALKEMSGGPDLTERIDAVFAVHRAVEAANRPTFKESRWTK